MTLGLAARPTLEQLDRRSTSVTSEGELVRAHARGEHTYPTTPCACGDVIVAISLSDADLTLAVGSHNKTRRHLAWRAWREAD